MAASQEHPLVKSNRDERSALLQRLDDEEAGLAGNVNRLHNFVNGANFQSVSEHQQGLLKQQLGHMQAYLNVLRVRIKDLKAQ